MKSQFVTALTVAGVIGTAGTAMAANTDVLELVSATPSIGDATQVLLPTPSTPSTAAPIAGSTPDPAVSATPVPGASTPGSSTSAQPATAPRVASESFSGTTTSQGSSQSNSAPAPAPAVAPAPAPAVNGTTGGSGARVPAATTTKTTKVQKHEVENDD